MSTRDDQSGNARGPSRWVKSNLVALGSAAVLAVYSAGYARTRSAAERFAEESTERRPPERRVAPAAGEAPAAARPEAAPNAHVDSAAPVATSAPSAVPAPKPAATKPSSSNSETARSQVASTDTATAPVPVKAAEPATPVAPPAQTPPATTTTPPADTATKSADTAHVQLKDGTFSGWGTSRHGDIEAAVQIKDGRIVSSFIVQCLTRYSCSWISMLPGQVVTRQSPEVDYVSGATQSSNAFYYAIVEALSKAK